MKAYRGRRGVAPLVLNLCTRFRYVVNVKRRPLWSREWTTVSTELEAGWVPEPVSTIWRRKNFWPLSWFKPRIDPVRSLVTTQATISRLEKNLNYEFCPYVNFSSSCHLLPLGSILSPQHPVLVYPQSMYVLQGDRKSCRLRYRAENCSFV